MEGKVKTVDRGVYYEDDPFSNYPVRHTNIYAILYDNKGCVNIDEDEVRDYYGSNRITKRIIYDLDDQLHNQWIEYYEDDYGKYWLDGDLEDYLDD